MTAPIRDMAGLVEAIRRRKDDLDLSNETIDAIAGFQSGYASKVLAPKPVRNVGYMSLGSILGALGVGLVIVEDEEARIKVQGRWQARKRTVPTVEQASRASIGEDEQKTLQFMAKQALSERMKQLSKLGASKGGKRRAKVMKKRARQAVAAHAARQRWAKEKRV